MVKVKTRAPQANINEAFIPKSLIRPSMKLLKPISIPAIRLGRIKNF